MTRFARKLCDAGYKLRSTPKGKELFYVSDQDIRTFSRRSALIQQESVLHKEKLERDARFLVRITGITFEQALAVKLGQLGATTRERKSTGKLSKEAQIEHWRQHMGESRWDSMTVDAAKALIPTQPLTGSVYAQTILAGMSKVPVPHWNLGKGRETVGRGGRD